jgi:hypothetical protein
MLFAEVGGVGLSPEDVAVLVGALFAGAVCGIWPLSAGAHRGRPGLGVTGFVCCVVSGFLLGCLLALPIAVFFRLLIGALGHPNPPGGPGLGGRPFDPYAHGKRADF